MEVGAYICMDFVIGLPRSPKGHEAIWVIVDRMTKTTHFILVKMNYSLDQLAQIYIDEIVSLHRVPASIVSDRDPRFTLSFGKAYIKLLVLILALVQPSTHKQMDCQKGLFIL